jgi:catechol 2,3-dioxygenase-like lactoylglutathione lyase family enzyme
MDYKLELVTVPVSDVDRAKHFYAEQMGFRVLVDHQPTETFRVVQLDPPGSACSIAIGTGINGDMAPGSIQGLQLMVTDIVAARDELVGRGVDVEPIWNMSREGVRGEGPHADREDYQSFASLRDPDGNLWLLQERGFSG